MNRKEFVQKTGAAALLVSMGLFLDSCTDSSEEVNPDDDMNGDDKEGNIISFDLNENPFDALKTDDAWLLHPSENILILNVGGDIRAFTSVCTHSGCVDDWSYGSSTFTCNCHGSQFDNQGKVTKGPASSDLKEYSVEVDGDTVNINVG